VIVPDAPQLNALYGADLAIIRPDQHVAWRGSRAADACVALMLVAGRASFTNHTETPT
jgi:hypothetical protein